jgi:hypothetical protein
MGTPEKIYELVKALPETQAVEVLDFVEFLRQKTWLQTERLPQGTIPQGTLTGLRGIAKRSPTAPTTDADLQEEYADYLSQKYQ